MPTVAVDVGKPSLLPCVFSDGPLQGNDQWNIPWLQVELREVVEVGTGQDKHNYKIVDVTATEVVMDHVPG